MTRCERVEFAVDLLPVYTRVHSELTALNYTDTVSFLTN